MLNDDRILVLVDFEVALKCSPGLKYSGEEFATSCGNVNTTEIVKSSIDDYGRETRVVGRLNQFQTFVRFSNADSQ